MAPSSSAVYLPGLSSRSSAMPILPMSCSRAAWPISVASAASRPELEREHLARAPDPVGVLAVASSRYSAASARRSSISSLASSSSRVRCRTRSCSRSLLPLQLDAEVAGLQEVAHAQQHLGHVDRLRQEVARAQRQRAALGVRRDIGSQHEHGHPVRLLGEERDVLEDLGAAAPGHVPVEQQQVGRLLGAARRRTAMGSLIVSTARVAGAREDGLQQQGIGLLVVDHEDPRGVEQLIVVHGSCDRFLDWHGTMVLERDSPPSRGIGSTGGPALSERRYRPFRGRPGCISCSVPGDQGARALQPRARSAAASPAVGAAAG